MHRIKIWISALPALNMTSISSNLLNDLNAASTSALEFKC